MNPARLEQWLTRSRRSRRSLADAMPISEGANESNLPQSDSVPPRSPQSPQPDPSEPSPKRRGGWRWSLVWLAILAIFGGMGTSALIWLTSLPPLPNCKQLAQLDTDMERLYCAQQAARSGEVPKLVAGIDQLKQWSPDHPLYGEAQRLIGEWSNQLLVVARSKMQQSDLNGALDLINHIPKSSPVYKDAQAIVNEWKQQLQQGEAINAKAQAAMKNQDWDEASRQVEAMSALGGYWRQQRADALAKQLGAEKQAWQVLNQAQKLVESGAEHLSDAITLAQKVPDQTYAYAEARSNLKQWSQKLVLLGFQRWQKGDLAGATAMLQAAPGLSPSPEVQDLIQFSQAYSLANAANTPWVPSPQQVVSLMQAIGTLEHIPNSSPFYQQAQTIQKNWQAQLQDLIQIGFASLTAGLGQQSTLQLAAQQALQIGPDRPRRLQAQTLAAYWRQEAERIQDEPYLARAKAMAKSGRVRDLQAAMVEASQIRLGRSMRVEAQTWIATWRVQIQTIEDQPLLDRASALAEQKQWDDAINIASQIRSGRALYDKAQDSIRDWRAQQIAAIQIAQDQPILDRAIALADRGSLSAAINTASRIGYGRALSYRAQSLIARWRRELDSWRTPSYDSYPSGSSDSGSSGSSSSQTPAADPSTNGVPIDSNAPPLSNDEPAPPSANPSGSFNGYYDQRYYQQGQ